MRTVVLLLLSVVTIVSAHAHMGWKGVAIQSAGRHVSGHTPIPTTTPTPTLRTPSYVCPPVGMSPLILPIPSNPEEFESIFETRINHMGIILRTDQQVRNQINAYESVGMGPFVTFPADIDPGFYCGMNATLNVTVSIGGIPALLNPNATNCEYAQRAFFEISHVNGMYKNFYKDFYDINGPGIFYTGLGLKFGVSRARMLDLLARKNIKLLYSYTFVTTDVYGNYVTAYADFVRLGYTYHEIVSGDGIYIP